MSSPLQQLIYASAACRPFDAPELGQLLRTARANNARDGVTGMLLYADGSFFQVLEGEVDVVDAVFAKIERDARHVQVTQIIREPIPRRAFDSWTMGFYRLPNDELAGLVGVNHFFDQAHAVAVDSGRARKLLAAFREGRWRKKVAVSDLATSI